MTTNTYRYKSFKVGTFTGTGWIFWIGETLLKCLEEPEDPLTTRTELVHEALRSSPTGRLQPLAILSYLRRTYHAILCYPRTSRIKWETSTGRRANLHRPLLAKAREVLLRLPVAVRQKQSW